MTLTSRIRYFGLALVLIKVVLFFFRVSNNMCKTCVRIRIRIKIGKSYPDRYRYYQNDADATLPAAQCILGDSR